MIRVGRVAPDFTLPTDTGESLTLKSLRGRPVVLYFYPKDGSEACTIEACEFRDAFPRFDAHGATILGVSPDPVRSHARFKKKHALPFTLLADTEHLVAERYGLWVEKVFFGHRYFGVERTTIVIDARGRVAHIFEKVRTKGHAAEVATVVDALR